MTEAQMNSNEETMNDLLDETLDDLADMPETKPFPAGAHLVDLTVKRIPKKAGGYVVEMTHVEVMELANPADNHPAPGDKSTVFIHTKKKDGTPNELGQGQLKLVLKPLAALYETAVISEIIDQCKSGVRCAVLVTVRKPKEDSGYDPSQDIKSVEVV